MYSSTFLKTKILSNVSQIKIHYYLKLPVPIMHRHFFRKPPQNRAYVQTHCSDRRNPFHFACRRWYSYNNPHICYILLTCTQIRQNNIIILILV